MMAIDVLNVYFVKDFCIRAYTGHWRQTFCLQCPVYAKHVNVCNKSLGTVGLICDVTDDQKASKRPFWFYFSVQDSCWNIRRRKERSN